MSCFLLALNYHVIFVISQFLRIALNRYSVCLMNPKKVQMTSTVNDFYNIFDGRFHH